MKKNPIKSDLRETTAGKVTFLFLLFLYTGVMLYLFWMECYQVPGFQSDMPDYVNKVAGIAGNYEFPYPILFWTARLSAWLIGAKAAMAVTTALFNLAAVIITKYYMNREIRKTVIMKLCHIKAGHDRYCGDTACVCTVSAIESVFAQKYGIFRL